MSDGRCPCCSDRIDSTGGCTRCTSSQTFCTCGVQISCGCGRSQTLHRCPNVRIIGEVIISPVLDG